MAAKRNTGPKPPRDDKNYWVTPPAAIDPLLPHLDEGMKYIEPCAGNGALARYIDSHGHECLHMGDITPQDDEVFEIDALDVETSRPIITNPPFEWKVVKPLLDHWIGTNECWLLLPLDFICNLRMAPYAPNIDKIVMIGRVSWLGNAKGGMENFIWAHFAKEPAGFIAERTRLVDDDRDVA